MGEIPRNQERKNLNKIETLKEKGVVYFDVGLTSGEENARQEIRVENEAIRTMEDETLEFSYYGPINNELMKELTDYFGKLGGNSKEIINNISSLVIRVAEITQKDFNGESCWVNIRTTLPNNKYDIPRWHTDGRYFEHKPEEKVYKLVFTIKGSPTRFAEKTDSDNYDRIEGGYSDNYESNFKNNPEEYKKEDIRIRKELMSTVKEIDPPNNEQAVMYLVDSKDAKVHSEPKMNEPRVFMQILVGSKDQINEWKGNWKE